MSRFIRRVLTVVAIAALPVAVHAQDAGNGFLFGAPAGSFTLHGGWTAASAGSDLFAFTTNELTLKRRDFSSPEIGGDLALRIAARTELVMSSSASGVWKHSEFRHFIDNKGLPIEQTTTFKRIPVTLGVRQYLTSTGRSIGKFAWIPARIAPYVGAGGGLMYYRFRQDGDFIDSKSMNVYNDMYTSEGWTRTAHVNAGVDYALGPRFALTTDARYVWSSAALSNDFSGFQPLDLSGVSTTVGLSVRF